MQPLRDWSAALGYPVNSTRSVNFRFAWNVFTILAVCLPSTNACRTKVEQSSTPAPHIYGFAAKEEIAPVCKQYARVLLKCVDSDHFPAQAKDAETSALAQMMDGMKLDDVAPEARAQTLSDAAGRCEDALNTLRESSKTACPGVF